VDEFEITFTSNGAFTLNNLTTKNASSGTFTFTGGNTFNIKDGFAVTISGTAIAGDKVRFSVSEDAASGMSVSSTITANTQKIAAGTTTNGDGGNALLMAGLQNELAFNSVTWSSGSGSYTFDEYYNAVVSTIGIESFSAQATLRQQEGIMLQLNSRRESISGVSIDEEMIKMIKFQQAYNASARMISVVDEMLDALNRM
jgi:flagellar hook-associated protein 1 FlgK